MSRGQFACEDKLYLDVHTEAVVRNPTNKLSGSLTVVLPRRAAGCRTRQLPHRDAAAGVLTPGKRFIFFESKGVFSEVLGYLPVDALPRIATKLAPPHRIRLLWPMPDSATRYCSDGKRALKNCLRAGLAAQGQDGNLVSPKPSYRLRRKTAVDAITGLMWQRATSAPLKLRAFKRYCRRLRLAGHRDWRVPSLLELASLLDFGRLNPSVDVRAFPRTSAGWYWTTTDDVEESPWVVHLTHAQCTSTHYDDPGTTGAYRVRCVRDSGHRIRRATLPYFRWRRLGLSLTDSLTGLSWQAVIDQKRMAWRAALARCSKLKTGGHSGWRLPTAKEMLTLRSSDSSYAHRVALPFHKTWETTDDEGGFWTGTPDRSYPTMAFYVKVLGGWSQLRGAVTEKYHVICVRTQKTWATQASEKRVVCPPGSRLRGGAKGDQRCVRGGQRHGPGRLRYPSGNVFAEGTYAAGRRTGRWTYYHDFSGIMQRGQYRAGRPHGQWVAYYDSGQLASRGSYRVGVAEGKWATWHPNGKRRATMSYVGGRPHGRATFWSAAGKKTSEGQYKNGQRHGVWIIYRKGKIVARTRYL